MDDALQVVVDMNANMWAAVKHALQDLTEEEAHWRPLPQANTISVIVRHLRIEAEWHLHSLEHGEPMPTIAVPPSQEALAAVSDDFEEELQDPGAVLHAVFGDPPTTTLSTLRERTATAYGKVSEREGGTYFLGYHHATHLAMHCGQIRAIRNLYCKTRGKPARFVPENPTYRS